MAYNADGSLRTIDANTYESAYGDPRFATRADNNDPNERFRSHTESVQRGGNEMSWDSQIKYDAVDKWDTQGGAIDTRSADRDQNRYGTSVTALEQGEVAMRKTAVTSMMDSGVTRAPARLDFSTSGSPPPCLAFPSPLC